MKVRSKNIIILAIIALMLNADFIFSQNIQEMFMYQIDGNKYEKTSYDKKDNIISTQIIEAGTVQKKGSKYILPVKIFSYDKDGKLEDTYETNYSCEPSEGKLFMHVFPLSNKENYTNVSIRLLSENNFYPVDMGVKNLLPDISFSMDIEGGVLGFFGANSKINISDRKISNEEIESKNYYIKEKMEINAYMFGFKIKTINYSVKETFNFLTGIIQQEYRKNSGEYFVITLIKS
ncbi:MAG: hypothetical protein ABI315_05870 [Bacteroidia bacterium]